MAYFLLWLVSLAAALLGVVTVHALVVRLPTGPNEKDDGGTERLRGASRDEGDIQFCLGPAYAGRRLKPAAERGK